MQAKGVFSVSNNALIPVDERAREIMAGRKIGDKVLVHVHAARWPEHHRMAWAVFSLIGAAKGVPPEKVLLWLKVATGRVDFEKLPNGKVIPLPQSINFESMSQDEFQRFWDDCWSVITEQLLPDLPEHEYEQIRTIVAREAA